MKKLIALSLFVTIFSCKNNTKETPNYSDKNLEVTTSIYPENITKVFEAHGGIDQWNAMKLLQFTMQKPTGEEITTTDLKNRKSLIEMSKHTIGYDGKEVWLLAKDTTAYKGNPKFYYNLMFYFYAMPFILGDDGIMYEDAKALVFQGKYYPGIKISYESGVGESPEDEYVLYYDAETYKMAWLGYTVTYFTKEKGKEFHFIKYSEWQDVNGLLLPKTLTWYDYENNLPTSKRNDLEFSNVKIDNTKLNQALFTKPESALIIE